MALEPVSARGPTAGGGANCCAGAVGLSPEAINALAQESTPEGVTRILSSVPTAAAAEGFGNCCPGSRVQ